MTVWRVGQVLCSFVGMHFKNASRKKGVFSLRLVCMAVWIAVEGVKSHGVHGGRKN